VVNGVFGGAGLVDPKTLLEAGVITEAQHKSFADEMRLLLLSRAVATL